MAIYSMAIILWKYPLTGEITNNIHKHQFKNNTSDLDSFNLKDKEEKKN